jgi:hypothetical protein
MWTRDDFVVRHGPVFKPVPTSMFGEVDEVVTDRMYKIPLRLWGAWESVSTLFPSAILNPVVGTSIFGTTDLPLVILARNGDQITFANAQLTKVSDLYLGVDSDLFAADVEFTALIANSTLPETASAYYTVATGVSYSENAFAKTNFTRARFTGAWGAITGFTAIVPQNGFKVNWTMDLVPVPVDGYGTVDMTLKGFKGAARCIPIGPTLAQIETNAKDQGVTLGSLLSASSADLTLASSAISIVLKNAGMKEHGYAFGVGPLRVGEMLWGTTRSFAVGVPSAAATAT